MYVDKPSPIVVFSVESDDDAHKIAAVLEALGYDAQRSSTDGTSPEQRARWAVTRLTRLHHLTVREKDVLAGVLAGKRSQVIADEFGIAPATLKWHMHNLLHKTGARGREGLLRVALQLPAAEQESDTP